MDSKQWKSKIKKACREAGTYRRCFESVIDTLAEILARRDEAQELFEESGRSILVEHTNKAGAVNIEQNPIVRLINDYNRDALSYWRDLGLTPAGLKKINEAAMKEQKKGSALEAALMKLGGA